MPQLDNGTWVPIVLSGLNPKELASWNTYIYKMIWCDKNINVKDQYSFVKSFIQTPIFAFTCLVGLLTLPATWRFSKRDSGSGFLILLHTVRLNFVIP